MQYVITGAFMLFDMVSGIIGAFKNKNFNSSVMREGLFHKCGSLLLIVFGILIDEGQKYLELGYNVPIAISLCAYICIMESGSIIENIGAINPELLPDSVKSRFFKLKGGADNGEHVS